MEVGGLTATLWFTQCSQSSITMLYGVGMEVPAAWLLVTSHLKADCQL